MRIGLKVNSDGAFNQGTRRAGVGGLIRDEDGRILVSYQNYLGKSSILLAELYGIWKGLELCKAKNYLQVEVESDSKVALDLIQQTKQQ